MKLKINQSVMNMFTNSSDTLEINDLLDGKVEGTNGENFKLIATKKADNNFSLLLMDDDNENVHENNIITLNNRITKDQINNFLGECGNIVNFIDPQPDNNVMIGSSNFKYIYSAEHSGIIFCLLVIGAGTSGEHHLKVVNFNKEKLFEQVKKENVGNDKIPIDDISSFQSNKKQPNKKYKAILHIFPSDKQVKPSCPGKLMTALDGLDRTRMCVRYFWLGLKVNNNEEVYGKTKAFALVFGQNRNDNMINNCIKKNFDKIKKELKDNFTT